MKNETKCFNFCLWIKDKKSEEIIELSKTDNLEIKWKGDWGKAEKEVVFKKNGKDYRILVRVLLKKFLLGTRNKVTGKKFLCPPNVSYEIYKGYMGEPGNSPEKDIERQEVLKLTNEWNWGRITVFLVIIIVVVIFECLKKTSWQAISTELKR